MCGVRDRDMMFDELRSAVAKLESAIASGPIVPTVTPQEIRSYLASRYDFTTPLALDEVAADVEGMLRTWQVQVTDPRCFGLFTSWNAATARCARSPWTVG